MSTKWNAKMQFPTESNYVNRITNAVFGPSKSSGNPMVTVSYEICEPQEVEIGGEMVSIAGVSCDSYFPTTVLNPDHSVNEEKTESARKRFKEFYTLLGLNPEEINWDNVDVSPLKGKVVLTMMSPDEQEQRANPSAAELAKNPKAQGKTLRNPVNNKPLVQYWPKVREVFGLAPNQNVVGNPY